MERPDRLRRVLGTLPLRGPGAPDRLGLARRRVAAPIWVQRRETPRRSATCARSCTRSSIHYDAVGSSERCFRALHDNRGLSSHFLLDLDGTIYQTLDLRERAFHAKDRNDSSVGIEIANIGAHSTPKLLQAWYGTDDSGLIRNLFPPEARLGVQRRRDVVLAARPARSSSRASVHGKKLVQYDFTEGAV